MTVYSINLGIGWASSGVEYAQIYRAKMFRNAGIDAKFVFTDLILDENIEHYTKNIGFEDNEIIWMYSYFTDMRVKPTTFTLEELEKTLSLNSSKIERDGKIVRYIYEAENKMMTAYLTAENSNFVNRVEYVSRGNLIRKDYFTDKKFMSEYFTPRDNMAYLYQRRYFNNDGTVAYEQILDGDSFIYKFPDKIYYNKSDLVSYFMTKLNLTENDVVLLDRETGIGQSVFRNVKPAKLGIIVHAEHFSENSTDDDNILWNNYYEYQFSNANKVDFFVTSTDGQTNLLKQQFKKYYNITPKVYTIPVGSLDELKQSNNRTPYSLITASRLAGEKNIPWLVEAVYLAKKEIPELTFDIYGSGGEQSKIEQLINKFNANDYIKLKGHKNLTDIYKEYEIYVTASGSEGFGLTLLEAIGSGLPIIGFNVRYGNPTFINDMKNGYLIEKDTDDNNILIRRIADAIIKSYKENNIKNMHNYSYERAEQFLTSKISTDWKNLVKEVTNND